MDRKKRIMIIGAGILQVPAIMKAKEMGLEVASIDMDSNAPGFRFSDIHFKISTNDIAAAVEKAEEIKPDGVMTLASDLPVRTVAAIVKRLGLTGVSPETALCATDKGKMRECLKRHNVPIPEFHTAGSYNEFKDAIQRFNYKCIVKPADNSGSRGVFLMDGSLEPERIYNYSLEYSRSGKVIAEEFMKGPEVSVETLTINGKSHVIAITDKLTTGVPNFVEMGHSIPSALAETVRRAIEKVACSAIQAIGIEDGPSHTEIIVTGDGPKVVELGARLGGDNITTHLVPLATGVDMVEGSILIALGEQPDVTPKYSKGAAIRYFKSPEGILDSVDGLQEAKAFRGVCEISFTRKPGDIIAPVHGSTDRLGYVISQAGTPFEAVDVCCRALEIVKINRRKYENSLHIDSLPQTM